MSLTCQYVVLLMWLFLILGNMAKAYEASKAAGMLNVIGIISGTLLIGIMIALSATGVLITNWQSCTPLTTFLLHPVDDYVYLSTLLRIPAYVYHSLEFTNLGYLQIAIAARLTIVVSLLEVNLHKWGIGPSIYKDCSNWLLTKNLLQKTCSVGLCHGYWILIYIKQRGKECSYTVR